MCILVETVELLFMKIFFAPQIWCFLALTFNLRLFWFYIFGKNDSVLTTISDLHKKNSTRDKQQNLMLSLRYHTKPKRNFFLGHPVYNRHICMYLWSRFLWIRLLLSIHIWLWLPYGVASKASNLVSAANKPSAGASWQRPAIGRLISASYYNFTYYDTFIQGLWHPLYILLVEPYPYLYE